MERHGRRVGRVVKRHCGRFIQYDSCHMRCMPQWAMDNDSSHTYVKVGVSSRVVNHDIPVVLVQVGRFALAGFDAWYISCPPKQTRGHLDHMWMG